MTTLMHPAHTQRLRVRLLCISNYWMNAEYYFPNTTVSFRRCNLSVLADEQEDEILTLLLSTTFLFVSHS